MKTMLMILLAGFATYATAAEVDGTRDEAALRGWQKPLNQNFAFKFSDLALSGQFPINQHHPFVLNGFDNSDKPYTLEIKTEAEGKLYHVNYTFTRGTEKESGSIILEKNKAGKMTTASDDKLYSGKEFSTKILE